MNQGPASQGPLYLYPQIHDLLHFRRLCTVKSWPFSRLVAHHSPRVSRPPLSLPSPGCPLLSGMRRAMGEGRVRGTHASRLPFRVPLIRRQQGAGFSAIPTVSIWPNRLPLQMGMHDGNVARVADGQNRLQSVMMNLVR